MKDKQREKDYSETAEKIRELVPGLKKWTPIAQELQSCASACKASGNSHGLNIVNHLCDLQPPFPPITLEDVLEAVGKVQPEGGIYLACTTTGALHDFNAIDRFHGYSPEYQIQNPFRRWELGKPFSEQSDETKQFITDLLK